MAYLIDTNVLLRVLAEDSPEHAVAMSAVKALKLGGEGLFVTPQVLIECCCAGTRPVRVNGFGWDMGLALSRVRSLMAKFPLLEDGPSIFDEWMRVVGSHAVSGKQVHDARLVAVMKAHGVTNLLTFNVDDFRAYTEIKAVHPASVA